MYISLVILYRNYTEECVIMTSPPSATLATHAVRAADLGVEAPVLLRRA